MIQAVKLRTLALGHNIWRKFFYKPNECMVAFFYEGNPAIFKNGVPHVRMYTCYEDEKGDRRVVEYGKLRGKHRGLNAALRDWKKYKVCFPSIPRYDQVLNGEEIQGAKLLAYMTDLFATKRMR